mmetsp:Transcript_44600/g.123704  ORF Transcript_44600/g.123704 Transcript_44600/m.123704 type:complete len:206 (-) Transcript_44600:393-1010(-)
MRLLLSSSTRSALKLRMPSILLMRLNPSSSVSSFLSSSRPSILWISLKHRMRMRRLVSRCRLSSFRIEWPCRLSCSSLDSSRPPACSLINSSLILKAFSRCGSGGGMLSAAVHTSSYGSAADASAQSCTKRSSGRVKLDRSDASASEEIADPRPLASSLSCAGDGSRSGFALEVTYSSSTRYSGSTSAGSKTNHRRCLLSWPTMR